MPAAIEAQTPSTAPLQASLAGASKHGQDLQGDLSRLGTDLRRAQQQESEQQKLAQLLQDAQADPANLPALLAYLRQPHDFAALTQPNTTDFGAIASEADRASTDAGALSADLSTVQKQVADLSAASPPALPDLASKLPSLDAALPQLPAAADALKGLSSQLDTLEQQLVSAGGPPATSTRSRPGPGPSPGLPAWSATPTPASISTCSPATPASTSTACRRTGCAG